MAIEHLSPDAGAESIAAALERDGAAIIDNLVDAAVLDRVHGARALH